MEVVPVKIVPRGWGETQRREEQIEIRTAAFHGLIILNASGYGPRDPVAGPAFKPG